MSPIKIAATTWEPADRLVITRISGDMDEDDVAQWEQSLQRALIQIEGGSTFRILVNLHGFTAANLDAHKRFRTIVPVTLARFGWKVGYLAMFAEEAAGLEFSEERGIRCTAAAHCHQDETKITKYESLYSSPRERFFTDPEAAEVWIRNVGAKPDGAFRRGGNKNGGLYRPPATHNKTWHSAFSAITRL